MDKKMIAALAALIVGAGAGFFGGIKYDQSKGGGASIQDLLNLPADQRRLKLQQLGLAGGGQGGRFRGGASGTANDFAAGQVLSKDSSSITIQLAAGGSKIVLVPASSQISKSTQGTIADLAVGQQVVANGTSNSDGSMTAQTIQIRPQRDNQTGNSAPPAQGK